MYYLVAERRTRQVIEAVAGAMANDEMVRIDGAEFLDRLVDIVIAERRHDIETPDDGMYLVDAGDFGLLLFE
jgi:hypothetical protein